MNKTKLLVLLLVIGTIIIIFSSGIFSYTPEKSQYIRGKVIEAELDGADNKEWDNAVQVVNLRILEGLYKGEEVEAVYQLSYNYSGQYNSIALNQGDEVFVRVFADENNAITEVFVMEIARDKYLLYLVIVFIILLFAVGGFKGIRAIVSLFLTIMAVVKILLPAILMGYDPVIISVVVCILIICITLIIVSGLNKKTLAAIIGTTGGVVVAGAIAIFIGTQAKITGLGNEEAEMLLEMSPTMNFNFSGLLFAGIIIAAMGATMDVSVSISSAMYEIKMNSPRIKTIDLLRAGMNVGKDAMGTMANTLILAYTGGALQLMLLLMANDTPFSQIVNWDMISSEILRAVAGSIGIVISIPITAFAATMIKVGTTTKKS